MVVSPTLCHSQPVASPLVEYIRAEVDRRLALGATWWEQLANDVGHEPFELSRDQYMLDVICMGGPICFWGASFNEVLPVYSPMNNLKQ